MRISIIGLIMLLALGVLAAPLPADAQQAGRLRRIGFLSFSSPPEPSADSAARVAAFRQGLHDFGWIEGKNIAVEYRGRAERRDPLPALAEELVRLPVELIAVAGNSVVQVVKETTTTVPIVMLIAADVVETGLVAS